MFKRYCCSLLLLSLFAIVSPESRAEPISAPAAPTANAAAFYVGDFTLALTQSAATLQVPTSAILTVNIAFSGGFSDPIVFSCTGVPVNSACSFSPTSVPASVGPTTSTLVINTAFITAQNHQPLHHDSSTILFAGLGLTGLLSAFTLRGRRIRRLAQLCALCGFCALVTACGNDVPQTEFPVAAGTYTIVVTGTGGGVSHSANFVLTVKPKQPFQ